MLAQASFRLAVPLVLTVSGTVIILSSAQVFGQHLKQVNRSQADRAPEWFNTVPPDSGNLIARGKAKSRDRQVAIDKAVAAARLSLAKSVDHRWEELVQAIQKECGSSWERRSEPVTLIGSTLKMQKSTKRGKLWTAFVLVALPEESVSAVMEQRLHRDAQWYSVVRDTRTVRQFEALAP